VILWPFLGWLDFSAARWLWALTSIAALLSIMYLFVQGSMAETNAERALVALMVAGTYPAGATIGNGQLTIHVMACVLGSVVWLAGKANTWRRYLVVPLIVFSMAKPSSALPFW